jgi:uncharacterized protein DUF481
MRPPVILSALFLVSIPFVPARAFADPPPLGTPPADEAALVAAPKPAEDAPKPPPPVTDSTTVTLSAGGQLATGNSRMLAMTANGKFEMRRGANGFGAAIIGNYGESATGPGAPETTTTENFQGRLRYDRYLLDRLSLFLIGTVRHDKFQGLDGRLNVDPGVKYMFVLTPPTTLWAELGYDFEYDSRNGDLSNLEQVDPTTGMPDPNLPLLSKTATDHSVRAFIGFKHAFNAHVTFVTGLEYLQSLYSSDTVLSGASTDYRINYDALFAANVGAGFSLGLGFSARYDHVPLPQKENTDTVTTVNLIYAFSDAAPPPPTCPCPILLPPPPPVNPPPPPLQTQPAPGAAPVTTTTTTTTTPTTTANPAPAPASQTTTTTTTTAPAPAPAPQPPPH